MAAIAPNTLTSLKAAYPSNHPYVDPRSGNHIGFISNTSAENVEHKGCKHLKFAFDAMGDGDTWASGLTGIVDHATRIFDAGSARITESAGTFTFSVAAGPVYGVLHIWTRGS